MCNRSNYYLSNINDERKHYVLNFEEQRKPGEAYKVRSPDISTDSKRKRWRIVPV
jgi:hypothetical protein